MSSATASADFLKGIDTYISQEYTTALGEWRPIPDLGLANAQLIFGLVHDSSEDVAKSNLEAVKWYRLAVKQELDEKKQREYLKRKVREAKRRREAREAAGEEPPFLDNNTKKSITKAFVKGLFPILLFLALGGLIWLIKLIYRKFF